MREEEVQAARRVEKGTQTEAVLRIQKRDLEDRGLAGSQAHQKLCQVLGEENKSLEGDL